MSVVHPILLKQDALKESSFNRLPPLSLYIHIPWCLRKCRYCDFYSRRIEGDIPESDYISLLQQDIEHALPLIWGRKIISVFLGGGTPSLFSAASIDRLLSMIRSLLPIIPDAEISMEANPATFETNRFKSYRESGINRLSLGIQSFNSDHLKALGRIHNEKEALIAAETAGKWFDNFNLDLMIGLPNQTVKQFESDVKAALSCKPTHISLYQLTIEPNTPFAKNPPILPDEEVLDKMQQWMESYLCGETFQHYEVSAWAKAGFFCRHNSNYWLYGDYLGIGAAAYSKITMPDGRIMRWAHTRNLKDYMTKDRAEILIEKIDDISAENRCFEFMMNALRLENGFPTHLFEERTGLPLSSINKSLKIAESKKLLVVNPIRIKPTLLGKRFLNDLQEIFLPD